MLAYFAVCVPLYENKFKLKWQKWCYNQFKGLRKLARPRYETAKKLANGVPQLNSNKQRNWNFFAWFATWFFRRDRRWQCNDRIRSSWRREASTNDPKYKHRRMPQRRTWSHRHPCLKDVRKRSSSKQFKPGPFHYKIINAIDTSPTLDPSEVSLASGDASATA